MNALPVRIKTRGRMIIKRRRTRCHGEYKSISNDDDQVTKAFIPKNINKSIQSRQPINEQSSVDNPNALTISSIMHV